MSAPARRMLTSEQAADYCGFKSVAGFVAHVKVRPVMFGRIVRYDVRDLDAFLDTFRDPAPNAGGFAELISASAGRGRS